MLTMAAATDCAPGCPGTGAGAGCGIGCDPPPVPPPPKIPRNVSATFTASALRKYTTRILPVSLVSISRLATNLRTFSITI